MIIIFKYLMILVCFLSPFPWSLSDNIIAMESFEEKLYESKEIEEHLKNELASLDRGNAPLFELTTKKGRKVYILGSFHNRHPEFLLSQNNFQFIKSLENKAVLFIEHHTPYTRVMKKIFENGNRHNLWDISLSSNKLKKIIRITGQKNEEILVDNQWDDLMKTWKEEKEKKFSLPKNILDQLNQHNLPKIDSIQKIDLIEGLLFFYEYSLDKGVEFTLGFESTLLGWNWNGKPRELEDPQLCLQFFENDFKEALSFFQMGLNESAQILQYRKQGKGVTLYEITEDYKKSMENYYNPDTEKQDDATIARNSLWCQTLEEYLKEDDQSPILIVCGAAHLRGESNFIQLLLKTNLFKDGAKQLDKHYSGESL